MPTKKIKEILAVIAALILIASCHTYYKATHITNGPVGKSIDSLKNRRFFILRNGDEAFAMTNLHLSPDQRTLYSSLDQLPPDHVLHLTNGKKGKMQYSKNDANQKEVTNEVHLFTTKDNNARLGEYTLSLDRVYKIEVLEHDRKRTTNSYVIGTIGTVLGSLVVAAIIIAATKSSCPFISAYDGNDFSLQGETYGGAIYPQLARKDYLPLKMSPLKDGSLQLKITNELKEIQYTDYMRLWQVSHPANSKMYVNQDGELHCLSLPTAPIAATLEGKKDLLPALLKAGDYNEAYMDDSSREDAINDIVLKFKRPIEAKKGKLILTLKNSYWLDLLYGEMAKGLGTYYANYMEQQKRRPASELLQWVKNQSLPLSIQVKGSQGWQTVKDITTTGPVAYRETAVSIDLPESSSDVVEIKLSAGFLFWEIDYAAMDFGEELPFTIEKTEPVSAYDETGKDVLSTILKEDGSYLTQPEIGNAATISFRSAGKKQEGQQTSYILESKGYYEHIREFNTKPNVAFMQQFRNPGGFPKYGKQLYGKVRQTAIQNLAKAN